MSVLIDTGPLLALLNTRDRRHEDAVRLLTPALDGHHGALFSTDYVLDEGLTLARRRPGRRELSQRFAAALMGGPNGVIRRLHTTVDVLEQAISMHFHYWDQDLCLTDCTLIVHAQAIGARIATFDSGFRGLVDLLES